jgi:hypothetical protein
MLGKKTKASELKTNDKDNKREYLSMDEYKRKKRLETYGL